MIALKYKGRDALEHTVHIEDHEEFVFIRDLIEGAGFPILAVWVYS